MGCVGGSGLSGRDVPAEAELPTGPVLVLAEDATMRPGGEAAARQAATAVVYHLIHDGGRSPASVLGQETLDQRRAASGDASLQEPLDVLAEAAGAEAILYLRLAELSPRSGTGLMHPTAAAAVRVVDADGRRLFPTGEGERWIRTDLLTRPDVADTDRSAQERVLADALGRRVARLFFRWRRPAPGERVLAERERVRAARGGAP